MVVLKNPENYKIIGFEPSSDKLKKYDAILKNITNNKIKKIPFGDIRYQHFEDNALGIYKYLNHYDKHRRQSYRARHHNDILNKYSSGWFSYYYLW